MDNNAGSYSLVSSSNSVHTKLSSLTAWCHRPRVQEEAVSPKLILYLMYGVQISDAIVLTIIVPFVPEMCRDRFGISEEYVGMAAGFLVGAFSFAVFVSSFLWGHIADHYGRKYVVVVGLLSGAISTLGFALSPNFWVALGFRIFGGLTNSNAAISKAAVADVTTGEERSLGFAYLGACFSLSRAISSAFAGPASMIDFSGVPILEDNKYLFPCLVGAAINFITMVGSLILLPETLKKKAKLAKDGFDDSLLTGIKVVFKDRLMVKLLVAFSINHFCNGGILVALVLLYSLPVSYHGLGFNPLENGIAFAWFALMGFLFQILLFKRVQNRLGLVRTYLMGAATFSIGTALQPCLGLIYWLAGGESTPATVMVWLLLLSITLLLSVGFMITLPLLSAMQSNATDPRRQGLTQGIANSVSKLVRSLGPALSGMIFSFSAHYRFPFVLFWFLAAGYMASYAIIQRLPEAEKRLVCISRTVPVEEQHGLELTAITAAETNEKPHSGIENQALLNETENGEEA